MVFEIVNRLITVSHNLKNPRVLMRLLQDSDHHGVEESGNYSNESRVSDLVVSCL